MQKRVITNPHEMISRHGPIPLQRLPQTWSIVRRHIMLIPKYIDPAKRD